MYDRLNEWRPISEFEVASEDGEEFRVKEGYALLLWSKPESVPEADNEVYICTDAILYIGDRVENVDFYGCTWKDTKEWEIVPTKFMIVKGPGVS